MFVITIVDNVQAGVKGQLKKKKKKLKHVKSNVYNLQEKTSTPLALEFKLCGPFLTSLTLKMY